MHRAGRDSTSDGVGPLDGFVGALAVAAALAGGAPAAQAASVSVEPGTARPGGRVVFTAAPGERNDVGVSRTAIAGRGYLVTVRDALATIAPGPGCAALDPHTATCATGDDSVGSPVELLFGDGDDRFAPAPASAIGGTGVTVAANGGAGDDVLDLRQGAVVGLLLDGGGGRDEIHGAQFADFLTDGDLERGPDASQPESDILDGGEGQDVVSYDARRRPVRVDLAAGRGGGRGEADLVQSVEAVLGGSGDDRLAGTDAPDVLSGGPGRDVLTGRAGRDRFGELPAGMFAWAADGDSLASAVGTADDVVRCGPGPDEVVRPTRRTFMDAACERVLVPRLLPPSFGRLRRTQMWLPARPAQRTGFLAYPVECSDADVEDPAWARLRCSGTVTLRTATRSQRLLARGRIPPGQLTLVVRLRPTADGRRLMRRPGGVRAVVRVRGRNLPTATWKTVVGPRSAR